MAFYETAKKYFTSIIMELLFEQEQHGRKSLAPCSAQDLVYKWHIVRIVKIF